MLLGLSSHLRRTLLNNPILYSYRSFGTKIGSSEERLAHTMMQLHQKRAVLQKELAEINGDIANVNMMMGIEETSETAAVFESIEARAQTQLLLPTQNVAEQKKVHAVSKKSKAKSLKQNAKKPKPAPRRRYVANNNANTSSYHEQKYNGITAALRRQNATRTRDINVQVTEFLSTIKTERASLPVRVSVPTKARVSKRASLPERVPTKARVSKRASLPERVPTKARVQNSGKTLKAHSTSRVENDNSKKSTMAKISNDDNFPKGEVEASPTVDGLESSLGIYDEDDQELLANMFNNFDGLDQPDDDDNNQNVYFTEGLSITRRKENGKWVYSMVDDY
jgi:hypothetical protein